jgi:hypothetical protein
VICERWSQWLLGITLEVVEIAEGHTYIQGEMEASIGDEWSSKEMDECPFTPSNSWDIPIT